MDVANAVELREREGDREGSSGLIIGRVVLLGLLRRVWVGGGGVPSLLLVITMTSEGVVLEVDLRLGDRVTGFSEPESDEITMIAAGAELELDFFDSFLGDDR